ncbi:MAG: efflux RND transporter periplasmic adaptor subunit [Gammaproteobacteria bacterium]
MKKRMIIMLIVVGILFGAVFGWYSFRQVMIKRYLSSFHAPAVVVSASKAKALEWTPYIPAIGSLQAIQGVDVTVQTSGIVSAIHFESGTFVNKGDALIELDDREEQANLQDYLAQYKLSKLNYDRDVKLLKKGAVSQSTVDTDYATMQETKASVEATKVKIAYKHVIAPFDGKLGIREIDIGQYISAGTPIVPLQSLNPLYVEFTLPEKYVHDLSVGQDVEVVTDSFPNVTYKGIVNALASQIDESTRSITVQAIVPNESKALLPGMFARIHVLLPKKQSVVTIPQTAVAYNLYGNTVYVIEQEKQKSTAPTSKSTKDKTADKPTLTVKRVYVEVGDRRGDVVEITKGVKAGDMVVTSGQIKLSNGDPVTINNEVEP